MISPKRVLIAKIRSASSNNGHLAAPSAAMAALLSPVDSLLPIIAIPISAITVFTSAKSTFMRPSNKIKSVMPLTAPKRTSLACLNADSRLISLPRSAFS